MCDFLYYIFLHIDKYNVHTFELHKKGRRCSVIAKTKKSPLNVDLYLKFIATNCKLPSTVTHSMAFSAVTGCCCWTKNGSGMKSTIQVVCYFIIKTDRNECQIDDLYFEIWITCDACTRTLAFSVYVCILFSLRHHHSSRLFIFFLVGHDSTVNQSNVSRLSINCWVQ